MESHDIEQAIKFKTRLYFLFGFVAGLFFVKVMAYIVAFIILVIALLS